MCASPPDSVVLPFLLQLMLYFICFKFIFYDPGSVPPLTSSFFSDPDDVCYPHSLLAQPHFPVRPPFRVSSFVPVFLRRQTDSMREARSGTLRVFCSYYLFFFFFGHSPFLQPRPSAVSGAARYIRPPRPPTSTFFFSSFFYHEEPFRLFQLSIAALSLPHFSSVHRRFRPRRLDSSPRD